jgi:hypothetical protein
MQEVADTGCDHVKRSVKVGTLHCRATYLRTLSSERKSVRTCWHMPETRAVADCDD